MGPRCCRWCWNRRHAELARDWCFRQRMVCNGNFHWVDSRRRGYCRSLDWRSGGSRRRWIRCVFCDTALRNLNPSEDDRSLPSSRSPHRSGTAGRLTSCETTRSGSDRRRGGASRIDILRRHQPNRLLVIAIGRFGTCGARTVVAEANSLTERLRSA